MVMSGPGKLGWNPEAAVWKCLPRCLSSCAVPDCESVSVVSHDAPGRERVLTTKWSALRHRYVAQEVSLVDMLADNGNVLVWPVALNRLSDGDMDRAKTSIMSKPDIPATVWLQENTGLCLRECETPSNEDETTSDWCMELVIFALHRINAMRFQHDHNNADGGGALLQTPLRLSDALRLDEICEMEQHPHWLQREAPETTRGQYTLIPRSDLEQQHVEEAAQDDGQTAAAELLRPPPPPCYSPPSEYDRALMSNDVHPTVPPAVARAVQLSPPGRVTATAAATSTPSTT